MTTPATHPNDDLGDVVLRLRSGPSDVPASVRLRRLLKALLRSLGFRVVKMTFPDARRPPEAATPETPP